MSGMLEYKGYSGTVEYSASDGVLYGRVIGIDGLISYEGESVQSLSDDFMGAVDDYIELCAEKGAEPQKAYKGKFNVRVKPELHRSLAHYAAEHGKTLNSTVEEAIRNYIQAY
ncbi:MAG: type II toxin-antitoxin system HicB family antitoxin [Leptospirales bacterium]|nr:type II toxin-antitoxin system HicB family antitoxin [Leptospirales bacterium]